MRTLKLLCPQPAWSEAKCGKERAAGFDFPDCASLHPGYDLLRRHLLAERLRKLAEQPTSAVLARAGVVVAIEKRALLGEFELRTLAVSAKLDCRQRHRDALVVKVHVIAVDDALVRHDILIERAEGMNSPAFGA